jgi:hypothetical protein
MEAIEGVNYISKEQAIKIDKFLMEEAGYASEALVELAG